MKYFWLSFNLVCSIPEAALKFPRESAGKVSQKCNETSPENERKPSPRLKGRNGRTFLSKKSLRRLEQQKAGFYYTVDKTDHFLLAVLVVISFMNAIIKTAAGRRVYLILDNLKVHHSNKVSAWAKEHEAQIRLFHLPPYCPEYNPDEYLNNDLKRNLGTQAMVKTVQELEENATEVLNQFSADTEHVKSNFDHPKLKPYKLD